MAFFVIALLAWGVFAFGAVYEWAYWPLALTCAGLGMRGLLIPVPPHRTVPLGVATGLAITIAAISIQLIPLPSNALASISPETGRFLAQHQFNHAATTPHPISIDPEKTARGLALFVAFSLFTLGLARSLSSAQVRTISVGTASIGVALTLTALIQKAFWNGSVYGFWKPFNDGFWAIGPFINHNHFGGWMLMALPLTLGLLITHASERRHVCRDWRDRVLWLSSRAAGRGLLIAAAVIAMSAGLVFSASRSALACFLFVVLAIGFKAWRGQNSSPARWAMVAVLAAAVFVALTIPASDVLASRLAASASDAQGRILIWEGGRAVAERFPLVGTGLNTFGTAMLYYKHPELEVHVAEAHSDYLQLLAEGGVLLAVPVTATVVLFALTVARRFRNSNDRHTLWFRYGALVGVLAIALQETIEFSLQIPGNAVLFGVLCAIALRASRDISLPAENVARHL